MILCDFCNHVASFMSFKQEIEDYVYMCECCYIGGPCRGLDMKQQVIVRV